MNEANPFIQRGDSINELSCTIYELHANLNSLEQQLLDANCPPEIYKQYESTLGNLLLAYSAVHKQILKIESTDDLLVHGIEPQDTFCPFEEDEEEND